MAALRDQASRVDWAQAHADGYDLRKQVARAVADANRDNLQRARDVMSRLADHENYYRSQTLLRLDTYDDLKKQHVEYVHRRDVAALQGLVGGGVLGVIYTADTASHILAASGIPMAKFYNTVRGVADQTVKVVQEYSARAASPQATPAPAGNARQGASSALPAWATTHDFAANAAASGAGPGSGAPGRPMAAGACPPRPSDEQIRDDR